MQIQKQMNVKGMNKDMMIEKERRELARRLCVRAMKAYRQKFVLEEDLLNGVDRQRVLEEIDKVIEDVRTDKVAILKRENRGLQMKIDHICSLDDCDEEFEM